MSAAQEIVIRPLTPERWEDFVELFGPNGASQGCWCMFWRIRSKDYHSQSGETNQTQMKNLVDSGFEPGLLAYIDGNPVGWAAVAPRSNYARLVNSRVLKAVDDEPVWSLP